MDWAEARRGMARSSRAVAWDLTGANRDNGEGEEIVLGKLGARRKEVDGWFGFIEGFGLAGEPEEGFVTG